MNIASVANFVGRFLIVLAGFMFPPAVVDWVAGNSDWRVFVVSGSFTGFFGISLFLSTRRRLTAFGLREGFLLTVVSWIAIALFGSLPFLFTETPLSVTDAFFESMSGLTTTGSTVMAGLDLMPPGILLWRGILQWFGGIGIIVFAFAIFPGLKIGGMQLFRMESSDRSDKGLAHLNRYTLALVVIYVGLTLSCAVLLFLSGMNVLESTVHAMATLSTGGYSTSDASVGHFQQSSIRWIITVFMVLGSLPFATYLQVIRLGPVALFKDDQVIAFLKTLMIVIFGIGAWLWYVDDYPLSFAIRESAFNVVSIITTTGFATTDYTRWGSLPFGVFFFLMFIGGCAGSTSGGMKIFRLQLIAMNLSRHVWRRVYPHGIRTLTYNGQVVADDVSRGVMVFILMFLCTVAGVSMILESMGLDMVTAISAAVTAVANVGPGLGDVVGPSGSFTGLPMAAKWVLAAAMLLGRLEFVTVLVLFSKAYWRY